MWLQQWIGPICTTKYAYQPLNKIGKQTRVTHMHTLYTTYEGRKKKKKKKKKKDRKQILNFSRNLNREQIWFRVCENDPITGIVSRKYSVTTTPIIKRIAHIDACTEASILSALLAAGGGSPPSWRSCGGQKETSPNIEQCVFVCVRASSLPRSTPRANIHTFYMDKWPTHTGV